jgi:S1-C subfamily serine protease
MATDEPKAGDKIFAVTTNAKGELATAEGTVKALRQVPAGTVIEVSMPIPSTSSGGGVFDQYGRLIGVATTPHAFGPGHVALPATWIVKMRSRATPSK